MLDLIKNYVLHQENMLINSTTFDKEKAEARVHILEGLIAAVDKIDEVIKIIKQSENNQMKQDQLMRAVKRKIDNGDFGVGFGMPPGFPNPPQEP